MLEDKEMKNYNIVASLVLIGMFMLIPSALLSGQDDIYYMPSKSPENKSSKASIVDTSGMTNYEKYRAMHESNGVTSGAMGSSKDTKSNNSAQQSVFDTTNSITLNPAMVVVGSDTTKGAVTINNYYIDNDDRYNSSRRMYFDYYYSPYYYDPFYWDFSYSYGSPYFGFHYGYGYPYYYDSYSYYDSYWYRPYWYAPYYYNYWNGYSSGYYSGYYSSYGNYQINNGKVINSGGRRMGGYKSASAIGSASYSGGRYAGADTYHGTRRNTNINTSATTNNYPATSVRRQTTWDNYSGVSTATVRRSANIESRTIATTRPYEVQTTRRNTNGYTPSYSMPGTYTRANYNNNIESASRRQTQTTSSSSTSGNVFIVNPDNGSSRRNGSSSTYMPTRSESTSSSSAPEPRRSSESYSQPAQSSTPSYSTSDGGSRRSSSSSSSSSSTPSYSSGGSSSSGSSGSSGGTGRRR
jgi:hypothetical protein